MRVEKREYIYNIYKKEEEGIQEWIQKFINALNITSCVLESD